MRAIILITLFLVGCNAILPVFHQQPNATIEENNKVVLTYIRDIKERFGNRTQTVISSRIAKLFKELFSVQDEVETREPWNFFHRIMNFFRRINIFGFRAPEPNRFDLIKCAEGTNKLDCNEITDDVKYPEFIKLKEDIETQEPLFIVENPQQSANSRPIKEIKKFYKVPVIKSN